MNRRNFLHGAVLGGTALAANALAKTPAVASVCADDGTPAQFIPKTPKDSQPLERELEKYPRCPYCNMCRKEHHVSRMLVHYSDDLVDGVCSIHCLSLSLAINIDRDPQAIWGADYGATEEPRPLIEVDKLHFLLGAKLSHAMTHNSKHAFASLKTLQAAQKTHGGKKVDFEAALLASYVDMSKDVTNIRKRRKERREKAAPK